MSARKKMTSNFHCRLPQLQNALLFNVHKMIKQTPPPISLSLSLINASRMSCNDMQPTQWPKLVLRSASLMPYISHQNSSSRLITEDIVVHVCNSQNLPFLFVFDRCIAECMLISQLESFYLLYEASFYLTFSLV